MSVPSGVSTCPEPLPSATPIPLERSLKLYHLLLAVPGIYTLAVGWTPYLSHARSCDTAAPQDSEALATVDSNPVTIRITEGPATPEEVDSATEYTAWQSHFTLTDTPMGKHTGLLDQDTGLEWLRLSSTANNRRRSSAA